MDRYAKFLTLGLLAAIAAAPQDVASAASSPTVVTGRTSSVSSAGAVLHGTVNPNGSRAHYRFEWGLTAANGAATPLRSAGSGSAVVSVDAPIGGLLPGTVYHYRLVASNGLGQTVGAERSFKTKGHPPAGVATGPPIQIGRRGATLSGTVDPKGEVSTFAFQYGLTTAYGSETLRAKIGAGNTPRSVTAHIAGLSPGTVFHYRIVAFHGGLPSFGTDATFVTLPLHRRIAHLRAKASPRRALRAPYAFSVAGQVLGGESLPASARCSGTISVAFLLHRRRVALRLVPVQPDCSFFARAAFRHLARRHRGGGFGLRVRVRFGGNGYLTPARARPERVRVGHR